MKDLGSSTRSSAAARSGARRWLRIRRPPAGVPVNCGSISTRTPWARRPKVIEKLREQLTPESLSIYPEYGQTKQELAAFFSVDPDDFILTNGTDEAIQVLINTYVDDGDEVLLLHPSYAMYRFYAELAGAPVREIPYRAPEAGIPAGGTAGRDHAGHARRPDRESQQSDRHRHLARRHRTILEKAARTPRC